METEVKAVPEIVYTDPFTERTPRKSRAWFNLRTEYLSYKVELQITNIEIPITSIERNSKDGGKWRWDTPLFEQEVNTLLEKIQSTGKFEAIWLRKDAEIYSILDGHHRLVAWTLLGNSVIPAVVVAVSPMRVMEFK